MIIFIILVFPFDSKQMHCYKYNHKTMYFFANYGMNVIQNRKLYRKCYTKTDIDSLLEYLSSAVPEAGSSRCNG